MPLLSRFETPGGLGDLPPGSPFYDRWHERVRAMLGVGRSGPGGAGEFYNASTIEVEPVGSRAMVWMGFPRRLLLNEHRDDRRRAFELSDERGDTPAGRSTQIEYLEWHVERNASGKITKVTFTTEIPEYWDELFRFDRARVLELYRTLVSPAVVEADLVREGTAEYNPRNVWNTSRGVVHYIVSSPANTLGVAIGLSQGSVDLLGGRPHPSDNFELDDGVQFAPTSADPRMNIEVNAFARKGLAVTFGEPLGVYMAGWDDTGWSKPNGSRWATTGASSGASPARRCGSNMGCRRARVSSWAMSASAGGP